jgi:hypothetical protein
METGIGSNTNSINDSSIQIKVFLNNKEFFFTIDDENIIQYILLSEDPETQIKILLHNGYLLSKCIPPSKSCCPELTNLCESISPMIDLFRTGGNSSKNGKLCEILMGELFKKMFPTIQYIDTSNTDRNGDAVISIKGLQIMIDYKNYNQPVPSSEVEKLVRDLKVRDISLGILYSTKSKVSKKDILDYDIIDGKLIVFMCGEGVNPNSLIMAIKFILHLHESNAVVMADKVCELVNKTVGNKLVGMYEKILNLKDELYRHNERIDETAEKLSKQMNNLKEDTIHMISHMLEILSDISGIVEENKRESGVIVTSHQDLIDFINRKTDKKKDITHCIHLLTVAEEMGVQCGISNEQNHIVLFKNEVEIGKLKITKSNSTLIMYNLSEGVTSFHCVYEEVKQGNFHISLNEKPKLWEVVKNRFQ